MLLVIPPIRGILALHPLIGRSIGRGHGKCWAEVPRAASAI